MSSTPNIAVGFLAARESNFEYQIFRRRLTDQEESVPGTRYLPADCEKQSDTPAERQRYEIAFEMRPGFEPVRVSAWLEQGLTDEVLHNALIRCTDDAGLRSDIEIPDRQLRPRVAFVLARHGDAREVIWLRAYGLQVLGRFGFLCEFQLRVPRESSIPVRKRLELSLAQKNGRSNEDYYLDQHRKIELFIRRYFRKIARLRLHDGTLVELDAKLPVVPSFTLARRTYVFGSGREGRSQFFGLRDHGPFQAADPESRLVFVFTPEDRERSQHLYRALRGDVYTTFPGMEAMFRTKMSRDNISGIGTPSFSHDDILSTARTLKQQFPSERIVPVGLVPFSNHTSDEETAKYYAAKHAFVSEGLASQFVDRKRTLDRNALKWSVSNIGLGLFAKMGGVPWRVKPSTTRCLIVGIGQAHRHINRRIDRYVAYSVLTDSTGGYETIKVLGNTRNESEYLSALHQNLRNVLVSHSTQYDSFVLHATFNIRRREIEAIQSVLKALKEEGVDREFVAIKFNDRNDFFGFSVDHNSRVPYEGTVAPLSKREFLMWFSGLSLDDSKIPKKPERPVHLRILYPDMPLNEDDLRRVLQDAMNIAGANWRGFTAKSMPISVYYAEIIARNYAYFREAGLPDVNFEDMSPWFL